MNWDTGSCRRQIRDGHKDGFTQGNDGQQGDEKLFHDALRKKWKKRIQHDRTAHIGL